ncbi:hypothetical protein Desdi_3525 [Desulfitobacterium dichloroeliminans LMG P-21439]|uniref:DUF4446 domain-containing protein n=1 Tax=Desulfitobacterium dichloroeliminans (strain LMG P-21439 / DCA1) TaxID=871963 RepID=L0FD84_DESDL|nr:DUF4446 family protein [Desulfitobacterium dichloroeliminans]AGA70908.1 hypothetical protein Desdi_3525 [Desulfitobacterium dichloroeliminans LMG P-21439]
MNLEQIMPLSYWAIAVVGFLCIIEFILIFMLNSKMRKFQNAYLSLQTFVDGSSLDQELKTYREEVKENRTDIKQIRERVERTERKLRIATDRAELVRFSAFENMGSDLSFSLALLNQEGSGVVISSINNRDESRVYAKPIVQGESTYHLSEEERQAINKTKDTLKV